VNADAVARAADGGDTSRIAAAYEHCAGVARTHYENFTIGSWLLPRRLRLDLAAVYAFARGADDLADEGPDDGRVARLAAWEESLLACARDPGGAGDPVFIALGHTIARHDLPLEPFRDLLRAFRRDATGDTRAFPTFADVLEYCRCSANPVGRIVLALFGHRDAERAQQVGGVRARVPGGAERGVQAVLSEVVEDQVDHRPRVVALVRRRLIHGPDGRPRRRPSASQSATGAGRFTSAEQLTVRIST